MKSIDRVSLLGSRSDWHASLTLKACKKQLFAEAAQWFALLGFVCKAKSAANAR
jgi:hypothetical protein